MSIRILVSLIFVIGCTLSLAFAAAPTNGWQALSSSIYLIHGGSLADRQAATAKDKKLSINIDGKAAEEIFESIGPDLPETCTDRKGDRERIKKGISCSYTAQDKDAKNGPYRCWIGLDLRTGESVGTVSC